jgi:hypothetical protein
MYSQTVVLGQRDGLHQPSGRQINMNLLGRTDFDAIRARILALDAMGHAEERTGSRRRARSAEYSPLTSGPYVRPASAVHLRRQIVRDIHVTPEGLGDDLTAPKGLFPPRPNGTCIICQGVESCLTS